MKNSRLTVILTLSIILLALGPNPAICAKKLLDKDALRKNIRDYFTRLGCPDIIQQVTECALEGAKDIKNGDTGKETCEDILGAVSTCYSDGVDNCDSLTTEQKTEEKEKINDHIENICAAIGLSLVIIIVIVIVIIAVISLICCLCCWCCNCCRR